MEKNNNSDTSVCRKIRQALSSNPALRAIQRVSSFNQQPKPITTGSNSTPPTKTKPSHPPPHHKPYHTELTSGAIPIKFDHSTPTTENENSSTISSVAAKGASTHVGNSERATKVTARGEPQQPHHVPMRYGVHSEKQQQQQQGEKSMDINDTFKEFIQRAKEKIRTVSNVGTRGGHQSNPAAAPDHHHEVHRGTSKNENHMEQISDFINRAKKRIRATTTARKTGSLRRE